MSAPGRVLRRLLRTAHQRFPRSRIWPLLLGASYTQLTWSAPPGSEARRRYAAEALRWRERRDASRRPRDPSTAADEYFRLIRLGPRASLAVEAGDLVQAERWASEALRIPDLASGITYTREMRGWRADPFDYSVHEAHIVLGKVALVRSDIDEAARRLELAGTASSRSESPAMRTIGPRSDTRARTARSRSNRRRRGLSRHLSWRVDPGTAERRRMDRRDPTRDPSSPRASRSSVRSLDDRALHGDPAAAMTATR
jgi:hypothetical protein